MQPTHADDLYAPYPLPPLHRARGCLVSQRTGIVNQIRAFLLQRGVAVRRGLRFLRAELPRNFATPCDALSPRMRSFDPAEDFPPVRPLARSSIAAIIRRVRSAFGCSMRSSPSRTPDNIRRAAGKSSHSTYAKARLHGDQGVRTG